MAEEGIVVGLRGHPVGPEGVISEELIFTLKDLLAKAETGEIKNAAIVHTDKRNMSSFVVVGHDKGWSLLGGIAAVQHRVAELLSVA